MSLDLKRRLSDISEDGPTKKLRSEDLDLPSRADIASMPTDMSPSPQLTSEERKHPPELTWAEYQDCLQLLRSIPSALTDPIIWLQRMLSFISERKPGICAPVEMAGALLRDDPELRAHLVRRDFESALNSRTPFQLKPKFLATKKPSVRKRSVEEVPWADGYGKVIMAAWQTPYIGTTDVLERVLQSYRQHTWERYTLCAPFTQSSGTGKSRMIDELAKKKFCLPISFGNSEAYPPPDQNVQTWFGHLSWDTVQWRQHLQAFLFALFQTALVRVQAIGADPACKNVTQIASEFRRRMSEGMIFGRHGEYRQEFYKDVLKTVDELLSVRNGSGQSGSEIDVKVAANSLITYLDSKVPPRRYVSDDENLVILCFDDSAQLLISKTCGHDSSTTLRHVVRQALATIGGLRIFTLFLSKMDQVEYFPLPPPMSNTAAVLSFSCSPFEAIVWTPLDVFARRITKDKAWTLSEVASTYHIAHLGRPLFPAMYDAAGDDTHFRRLIIRTAGEKLFNSFNVRPWLTDKTALPCIAVRIPIKFSPVSEEWGDANLERSLVADHMRILLYAGSGFTHILTTSPSEPLLAEAAYLAMVHRRWSRGKASDRSDMRPFRVLYNCFGRSLLSALGARGETVAALLLLLARDCATTIPLSRDEPYPGASEGDFSPDFNTCHRRDGAMERRIVTVAQFLEKLLGEANFKPCADSLPRVYQSTEDSRAPLRDAFQDAFIYFNHFIEAQSRDVANQEYLLLAISRGAAIIMPNNDLGVDIIIPVLCGTVLTKEKVTAILVHTRNSRHYGANIQLPVFAGMGPYRCGLFDRDVENPPPVLRLVFALASPVSAVSVSRAGASLGESQSSPREKTAKFTAYEIWCAGASPETFGSVLDGEKYDIAYLLEQMRDPLDLYSDWRDPEGIPRALRQMQPLVSTHPDSISQFAHCEPNMSDYPLADHDEEEIVE